MTTTLTEVLASALLPVSATTTHHGSLDLDRLALLTGFQHRVDFLVWAEPNIIRGEN